MTDFRRIFRISRKVAVLVGMSLLAVSAFAQDWSQWRGPNRNGIVEAKDLRLEWPASGPTRLWKISTGKSYSSVTVQGNRAYTMGSADGKDTVLCVNATTGKPVWTYSYNHSKREYQGDPNPTATTSTPVAFDKRVYVLSREGVAMCLSAETGKPLWQKDLVAETKALPPQWGFAGSPVIEGERVLFNVGHHGVALDRKTGNYLWKSNGGSSGYATPTFYTLGKQKGVAFFNGEGVVGVDSATGIPFWEHKWKTRFGVNAIDPTFYADSFFIAAYGVAQRVRVADNKPSLVYETRNLQNTFVFPILMGDYLYGNSKGRLACMDLRTGETTWDSPGLGNGALIAVGKRLIVLSERGELLVVEANPAKYVEIARAKVLDGACWVHPTLANGRLYCHTLEGDLVCLDLKQ